MRKFDLVGIGSALVDVTIKVEENFLERENLPKGGMTLIDSEKLNYLLHSFSENEKVFSPGGSTANVISLFSELGGKGAFIGKVGNDTLGNFFEDKTIESGTAFLKLISDSKPTGTVISFITPDSERTFATYLGAAVDLSVNEISNEFLNQAPVIQIEAYLIFNRELFAHIIDSAHKNSQIVSLDLSSFNVVKDNLDYLKLITEKNDINIIFANEEEAFAFTGKDPISSLSIMSNICDTIIIKNGAKGSYLKSKDEEVRIPAFPVNVEDTNGAGDAYAGGVLFGLSKKLNLFKAGEIGSRAASFLVSQKGARLSPQNVFKIKSWINSYMKSV